MAVQIKALKTVDGFVVGCDESEAEYFGVYRGEPESFEWVADFDELSAAMTYAVSLVVSEVVPE